MPRKDERVPYLNEVVLEFSSGKREARISDLSPGGCFVDTIATVPVGESVSLEFKTPVGEMLRLTGDVAYVLDGFGFGVKFTDLTDEKSTLLDRLIKNAV